MANDYDDDEIQEWSPKDELERWKAKARDLLRGLEKKRQESEALAAELREEKSRAETASEGLRKEKADLESRIAALNDQLAAKENVLKEERKKTQAAREKVTTLEKELAAEMQLREKAQAQLKRNPPDTGILIRSFETLRNMYDEYLKLLEGDGSKTALLKSLKEIRGRYTVNREKIIRMFVGIENAHNLRSGVRCRFSDIRCSLQNSLTSYCNLHQALNKAILTFPLDTVKLNVDRVFRGEDEEKAIFELRNVKYALERERRYFEGAKDLLEMFPAFPKDNDLQASGNGEE